jgi:CSLREA domain-containing protein
MKPGMMGSRLHGAARRTALLFGVLLVALAVASMVGTKAAYASTFTVNSTGDEGDQATNNGVCNTTPLQPGINPECTLRAAIEQANANDNEATTVDTIEFSLGGNGVQTISPDEGLPVVFEPVNIDGYTQPGASENTLAVGDNAVLLIRLDGKDAGFASGLNIAADDSTVRGLSVTRFSFSGGIGLSGADNCKIEGNFLGTSPRGTTAGLGNGFGLYLQNHFANSSDRPTANTIGGASPEARNLISGNSTGLTFFGGLENKVEGNYIGTTKSGIDDLGNGSRGIEILAETRDASIGGTGAARNTIAFNGQDGVGIPSADSAGSSIQSNSIFSNGGLGIDLGLRGRTANDPDDTDTGANNLQNFPVLSSATTSSRSTTIKGTLNSTPDTTFTLRFYSNPSSNPDEGKKFVGMKNVHTDATSGDVSFTFRPGKKVAVGQRITATAAELDSNTSEFSNPRRVVAP